MTGPTAEEFRTARLALEKEYPNTGERIEAAENYYSYLADMYELADCILTTGNNCGQTSRCLAARIRQEYLPALISGWRQGFGSNGVNS